MTDNSSLHKRISEGKAGKKAEPKSPVEGKLGKAAEPKSPVEGKIGKEAEPKSPVEGKLGKEAEPKSPVEETKVYSARVVNAIDGREAVTVKPVLGEPFRQSESFRMHEVQPAEMMELVMHEVCEVTPEQLICQSVQEASERSVSFRQLPEQILPADVSEGMSKPASGEMTLEELFDIEAIMCGMR